MENNRLQADLRSLLGPQYTAPGLEARGAATPIPAAVGSARPKSASGSGGGIASPLTETSYEARTWHAAQTLTSSDGVFTLEVEPIHSIAFTDAKGQPVVLVFAAPPA